MPVETPVLPTTELLLQGLPDPRPALPDQECPRRVAWQLDLLLLGIEALDRGASEAMLSTVQEMELDPVIRGRLHLWRLRCTNPLRKLNQRRNLTLSEAKALTLLTCALARRLTVLIRQLLLAAEQLEGQQLSLDHHFRLSDYCERFRTHFRKRMNPKRERLLSYQQDEALNGLALEILNQLLFCTGTAGPQRLWASLFSGEHL
ncbi:MAG: DUF3038 domain-containing protein [Gloeomargaritaceae cyanobacterium C42_A2020_066]|nr:DUF3038 domain-containing protein [Gloeomargaritaceae cyanobacterium C42_A2020_066]